MDFDDLVMVQIGLERRTYRRDFDICGFIGPVKNLSPTFNSKRTNSFVLKDFKLRPFSMGFNPKRQTESADPGGETWSFWVCARSAGANITENFPS